MSSFQDASWVRRLWSLGFPGQPIAKAVANVNVVSDMAYRSSRERAPYASHSGVQTAPGAGIHNFIEITGTDALGVSPEKLLHFVRIQQNVGASGNSVSIALADGAALTTATRVATTPMFIDNDQELTPQLFLGTIATANIPAGAVALPFATNLTNPATPAVTDVITDIESLRALPFAARWRENSLIFFAGQAALAQVFRVAWQIYRA